MAETEEVLSPYPNNRELHRWAEAQPWGHKVSNRGISRALIAAWDKAHPDRPYVKAQAHHGTAVGYDVKGCRCDPCKSAAAYSTAGYHQARKYDAQAGD